MSKGELLYALLLIPADGYKEDTGHKFERVSVFEGSLLVDLDSFTAKRKQKRYDSFTHKVDTGHHPEIYLSPTDSSVYIVTKSQRDWLLGIQPPHCRLEVLKKLNLVESLKIGSRVYVTIPTIPDPVKGVVRYIGVVRGIEGTQFGIELLERKGEGTHDGHFKGHKYFKCDKDCAVFVAMDKVTDRKTAQAAKGIESDPSVFELSSSDSFAIRICDDVTFTNSRKEQVRGVVRNIQTDKVNGDKVVEIYLEYHLNPRDVPHCINFNNDKKYFSSKQKKIFLPITCVTRDHSRRGSNHSDGGVCEDSIPMPFKKKKGNPHNLVVGSAVQYNTLECYGIIRWIGPTSGKIVYAGVEMEDGANFTNGTDGTWSGKRHFNCKPGRAKFAMLSCFKPDERTKKKISLDNSSQSSGKSNGASNDTLKQAVTSRSPPVASNPYNLEVGSVIQFGGSNIDGGSTLYGVIKWIGLLPGDSEWQAGLEVDREVEDPEDGILDNVEYYKCKPLKGTFVHLAELKPCERTAKTFQDAFPKPVMESNLIAINSGQNPRHLKVGDVVQHGRSANFGVVKWIGPLSKNDTTLYAGLEMGSMIEGEAHDGVWKGIRHYDCQPNRGIFVQLAYLKKPAYDDKRKVSADDVLLNYTPKPNNRQSLRRSQSSFHARTEADQKLHKPELDQNPHKFEVGSTIQCGKNPVEYGVIKWMGIFPGRDKTLYAGVEMEQVVFNYTDGMFDGKRYFESLSGKGKFVKLLALQPDKRFAQQDIKVGSRVQFGNPKEYGKVTWRGFLDGSDEESVKVEIEGINRGYIPLLKTELDTRYTDDPSKQIALDVVASATPALEQDQPVKLKVGSVVQFGNPLEYGTIKTIEKDFTSRIEIATLEMENGKRQKKALNELELDSRFENVTADTKLKAPRHDALKPNEPMLEVGSLVQFGNPTHYGVIAKILTDHVTNSQIAELDTEDHKHIALPLSELKPDGRFNASRIKSVPNLEVGSLVQFGNPVQYGVIKKIEAAVGNSEQLAAVELENGQHRTVALAQLQPDNRFAVDVNTIGDSVNPLQDELYEHDDRSPPVPPDRWFIEDKHTRIKGIQGYQNSCYLDATVYGMFSFSDAFDVLLLEEVTTNTEEYNLQKMLRSNIVYPLRMKGIVVQDSVENFRKHLAELQNMKGLISEEKDPEEFLNLLFKHVLRIDPFITIRRPSGIDKEFFVQLFVEPDKNMIAVDTQRLLTDMFRGQDITFAEYPTRLLLQIPRYGKRFKSFQRVIPSLELDVASLCAITGLCSVCNFMMGYLCNECSSGRDNVKRFYCEECSAKHEHGAIKNEFDTGRLQLLSVLCIETSHYVCFTRITGSGKDEWVFFDSMAERQDNGYNLPKVVHCTSEMQEFVYGGKDIGMIPSKNLPELVRRFVEDAYLCIYVDHDGVMYQ